MPRDPVNALVARHLRPRRQGTPVARRDVLLAAAVCAVQTAMALTASPADGHVPTPLGWALLTCSGALLAVRRRAPWLTVLAIVACVGPYHAQDFAHLAAVPAPLIALYTMAVAGPPLRSFVTLGAIVGLMATVMGTAGRSHELSDMLRSSGWIVVCVLFGETVRIHRNYLAAVEERAERAERSREEEAARRVAQERLRIARDLHDLLAHSITLIGVQTSVAAHVLVADPERLDRAAVARALEAISDTCRGARTELRTTLEVLRAGDADRTEPLPGLSGLPDLARAACEAGARVEVSVHDSAHALAPAPAVGAAAYRIVQEALTNAVRHAGSAVSVRALVEGAGGALRVSVVDDGGAGAGQSAGEAPGGPGGFGIAGMRERARSVGGTLEAGARALRPGFAVTALLPARPTAAASESALP
ncbi:sensor histidine kinase [Streptomyces qinglanensis]|uniref:histidine kinase n=1 Tax=Streptomyces qinglanensis TaxID=943816 RepID=A0A1H9NZZ0_9ACTN|nr:histidine kinase [Streptomyces qinglanensis]SER41498.1 Signal transduction histidine kinase [Streptomyces qinglanensis]